MRFVLGPFALVNLKPNTVYMTKIQARNRAGNSEFTEQLTVRTLPTIVNSGSAALFDAPARRLATAATVAALLATRL